MKQPLYTGYTDAGYRVIPCKTDTSVRRIGDDVEVLETESGRAQAAGYRERAAVHILVSLAIVSSRPSSPRPQSGAAIKRSASMC